VVLVGGLAWSFTIGFIRSINNAALAQGDLDEIDGAKVVAVPTIHCAHFADRLLADC
jgi:hypothetical protein